MLAHSRCPPEHDVLIRKRFHRIARREVRDGLQWAEHPLAFRPKAIQSRPDRLGDGYRKVASRFRIILRPVQRVPVAHNLALPEEITHMTTKHSLLISNGWRSE